MCLIVKEKRFHLLLKEMKILGLSIEIKIKALKILTCFLVFLLVINLGMPVSQLKLFVVFVIYSINYYLFKIKIKSLKF